MTKEMPQELRHINKIRLGLEVGKHIKDQKLLWEPLHPDAEKVCVWIADQDVEKMARKVVQDFTHERGNIPRAYADQAFLKQIQIGLGIEHGMTPTYQALQFPASRKEQLPPTLRSLDHLPQKSGVVFSISREQAEQAGLNVAGEQTKDEVPGQADNVTGCEMGQGKGQER